MAMGYNDFVFINCPFDDGYMPLLQAIVFSVYRCGFLPVCALAEDDASDSRLDKIMRCVEQCRYSIHDISRTELTNNLPRFNMPFELGIFFGAKRFGNKEQKTKTALIFERDKFSYQHYISDLSGVDTKAHNNNTSLVVRNIRDWLSTASKRTTIPGYTVVENDYNEFIKNLPKLIALSGLNADDIPFNDFCRIVEGVVQKQSS